MSPLYFLAIPLVIFIVGSSLLHLGSRFRGSGARYRNAPDELRQVAPMLENQRQAGWPTASDRYSRR